MKKFLLYFLLLFLDVAIYFLIGLILLNYEDFYDESLGEYWSLNSMNFIEKIAYFGYFFWWIFNVILFIYIIYKIILKQRIKKQKSTNQ
jgi:hypothetical protein